MTEQEILAVCLSEECHELGKIACKIARFGADNIHQTREQNLERLVDELNDILAILEMLHDSGLEMSGIADAKALEAKKAKVRALHNL